MEDTATSWFSELGMEEDPFLSDHYNISGLFDEENLQRNSSFSPRSKIPRNSSTTSLSASSNMENSQNGIERPAKQHKPNSHNNSNYSNASLDEQASLAPSPMILSFGNSANPGPRSNPPRIIIGSMNLDDDNSVSEVLISRGSCSNLEEATIKSRVHKTSMKTSGRNRAPWQTYDHIIAERKRREQLSQQFVTLSAIVPALKKMDKTSVLGDTIKYLKHLQQREKELEEQAIMQTMESLVLVKKSQVLIDNHQQDLSDDQEKELDAGGCCSSEHPLPEVEAKVCDKRVLLRILCEKHKGVLVKILSEMGKLGLAVTNTNVAPFGSLALDITIITEMRKGFNLSVKELVKRIRSTLGRGSSETIFNICKSQ